MVEKGEGKTSPEAFASVLAYPRKPIFGDAGTEDRFAGVLSTRYWNAGAVLVTREEGGTALVS